MPGKAFVSKGVVGIDDIPRRSIAGNQVSEIETRFFNHRVHEPPVSGVLRIELPVGVSVVDLVELEPGIEELFHESTRFGFVEQAIYFGAERLGIAQLALSGQIAERLIRNRLAEKKRETFGKSKVVQIAWLPTVVEKLRRSQHR